MSFFERLKLSLKYRSNILKGKFFFDNFRAPQILSIEETLLYIINEKSSLCRFGDGEFNIIFGGNIGFQREDSNLSNALIGILNNPSAGLLIGLPGVFGNLNMYRETPREFWYSWRGEFGHKISKLLKPDIIYADTNATRFQTGFNASLDKEHIISLFKQIWNNRDVLIIEGNKTRMGVGNDLFDNALSIERILVPAENAFDRIEEIEKAVNTYATKDKLIILACGPTATVLAYNLHTKNGYQALDLGHLDLQYEYYRRGIATKDAIPGKYVNEADQREVDECQDKEYLNSIKIEI